MSKRIILISGYAQSGKDTLANALVERLDEQQPVVTKFAHPLRMALAAALKEVGLGHIDVWTEDPKLKEILRPLMVEFGKWCRARDKDVFVKATQRNVCDLFAQGKNIAIIPDLRYSNEVIRFQEWAKAGHEYRVNHLRIGRLGSLAANEEEFQSVKELMEVCPPDREMWFEPGDVLGIRNWATDLCRTPQFPAPDWLKAGNAKPASPFPGVTIEAMPFGVPVDPAKVSAYAQPNAGTKAWLERESVNLWELVKRIETLEQDGNCVDYTIDQVSHRVDELRVQKDDHHRMLVNLIDRITGLALTIERMEARLKRLEVSRG